MRFVKIVSIMRFFKNIFFSIGLPNCNITQTKSSDHKKTKNWKVYSAYKIEIGRESMVVRLLALPISSAAVLGLGPS